MRSVILITLGLFVLVFGCLQGGGGAGDDYHRNLTSAQLKPFYDAGCVDYAEGYLSCPDTSFVSQFNCFSAAMRVAHEGAGLEPSLALLECRIGVHSNNLTKTQMENYFFCGGGMLQACTSYIAWEDGRFIQIKNTTELARRVAPITNEVEAINYVLLSRDVIDTVERPILGNLTAKAERTAEGFMVTVYHYKPFGCYSKIDYEEVKFQVAADGKIEEKGRQIIYTKNLGRIICVD